MAPPADIAIALQRLGATEDALDKLSAYVAVLDKWRQRINLIGPASMDDIWRRHVLDSAQAWPHLDAPNKAILDLGAGAGLPGLILAGMGAPDVTLMDSDQRKAVFLREAARAMGVVPKVVAARFDIGLAEQDRKYHVVTARAVATISKLAPILAKALNSEGYALLHKGAQAEKELTEAQKSWTLRYALIPSITDQSGKLVKIWGLARND